MTETAFQSDSFQQDAFQISGTLSQMQALIQGVGTMYAEPDRPPIYQWNSHRYRTFTVPRGQFKGQEIVNV